MRIRSVVATLAACFTLAACQGLKDALSAHVDVVARTTSQDLTVTRLAGLLGNARVPVDITDQNAVILTGLWSSYHRLGYAAAHGDTMLDKINAAVTPILDNQRVSMLFDTMRVKIHVDSATEAVYDKAGGGLLAARQILFAYPQNATPAQKDSVRKSAESVRSQVNAGNFPAMAKKYSKDPQSAADGGSLGVLPPVDQLPEPYKPLYRAVAAIKPGEVTPLVETIYGLHILERQSWAEAKEQFTAAYSNALMQSGDSSIAENFAKTSDLQVKAGVATPLKAAVKSEAQHHDDHTVVATFSKGGKFTIGDFLTWVDVMPPDRRAQVLQGLPAAPDDVVTMFAKNMALHAVMLRAADSAKIQVPATEQTALRDQFRQMVVETWKQLNVAPEQLADSAKSTSDKEKLAAKRIDTFIDKCMAGEATPERVLVPLEQVLDAKYTSSLNTAGITRAVQEGLKIRAKADSAQASSQPGSSSVPMPGGPPGGPPGGGAEKKAPAPAPAGKGRGQP